jgi:mRNA interferase MazF
VKQFDVYTVSGGTYSQKPRPAVVIQANYYDQYDSVVVIPLTSVDSKSPLHIKIEPTNENGLISASYVMVEKVTTIKQTNLGEHIGQVDAGYRAQIENSLKQLFRFGG